MAGNIISVGKPQEQASRDEILQLVTFRLSDEEFGVDIHALQEIIRMMPVTRVPKAPSFVEGVVNLRGQVIPIIDLRKRIGMDAGDKNDKATRIIVVQLEKKTVGFIVDSVGEVKRIPSRVVEPPPPIVAGIESEYIRGVGKLDDRLLILLDLNKLLSEDERAQL
ncbi:MAG: chemotaxis protein CheW [Planctomycetes bacterium]|nr:chemotaxis protein CheW [Planctomycetota bacterium]NUQ34639.1 chemotaxis protein CheW [Planctomycetaceae bacterium]